ncbi:Death on curing protein, Doc toxin [Pseudonocardia sp. Ae406_Ps2]|uniref:type II toxin-antitoxin system death-on-curing family toxin n=1 Tax=unclassified Pseudonocardia TaxID=2619320 RepID=UPI00094AA4E9|nr:MULTISPECIES: Fic family protein [unclassified Pseudonocardia]OLL96573.1 Death on curing protein, Doc toxin [Pseudonocardia sp. Ae331_Ps2]OLM05719.1 Death on curing protein, Doc toxin [Pseudonocardia sp. Ae406_Ps2]OLM15123.1 Death on curing protein, Doc toxin [Pseudonocardia sp. Ae505_Ps2]OLM27295.1 Death on curing protein, Doc toxin [Pseudonocardia sp. Ae706_Ps2]OLM30463.1 Death on curing protein, Doc toxin [Pseudonocardia sp. Ae717_Ps2]
MTRYLSLADVLRFAAEALGQEPVVRDFGLLESALARPATVLFGQDAYPTLHLKAAALVQSICGIHALVDGNKRLAWASTAVFLVLNGCPPRPDQDAVFDLVVAVSEGSLRDLPAIAAALTELTGSQEAGE